MSKKRKTYSPSEKAKIVLEVLREESTLNEIATNYGVSPQLISRWKVEFIEHMPAVFDKKNTEVEQLKNCLLYTSDAADEEDSVDLGGRRIIKKKKKKKKKK